MSIQYSIDLTIPEYINRPNVGSILQKGTDNGLRYFDQGHLLAIDEAARVLNLANSEQYNHIDTERDNFIIFTWWNFLTKNNDLEMSWYNLNKGWKKNFLNGESYHLDYNHFLQLFFKVFEGIPFSEIKAYDDYAFDGDFATYSRSENSQFPHLISMSLLGNATIINEMKNNFLQSDFEIVKSNEHSRLTRAQLVDFCFDVDKDQGINFLVFKNSVTMNYVLNKGLFQLIPCAPFKMKQFQNAEHFDLEFYVQCALELSADFGIFGLYAY